MKKILIAILCAVMLFPASVVNAEDELVTVYCANADGSIVFGNETFQLYRITDENDEIAEPYKAVEESENRIEYAGRLQKVIQEQKIQPDKEVQTSEDGIMTIDASDGTYLVCGTAVEKENKIYTPVLMLLSTNSVGECYMKYEVTSKNTEIGKDDSNKGTSGKGDKTQAKDKKTKKVKKAKNGHAKTGDQADMMPYLLTGAAALAVIAVIARRWRKHLW